MKRLLLMLAATVGLSGLSYAQDKDTVHVEGFFESGQTRGTLNEAIEAAKDDGTVSNTVFKLTSYDMYVLSSEIFMEHGQDLHIVGPEPATKLDDMDEDEMQQTAPPQIVWTDEDIDREYIIQTHGDVTMENVWIRHADINGNQIMTGIVFENQEEENKPERGYFDGVIFDYAGIGPESGGAITVKSDAFEGVFKNSFFRNLSDDHFRYYGRAVSFPYQSSGNHYESLLFENTTFTNTARVVMMEGNQYGSDIHLNHVTILNTMEEVVQSGWLENMSITNSVIVNPYLLGFYADDVCDDGQDWDDFEDGECGSAGSSVFNITEADSFDFDIDFTDEDRQILMANTAIHTEDWVSDFMRECDICVTRINNRERDLLPNVREPVNEPAMEIIDSVDTDGNEAFPKMTVDHETIWEENPDFEVRATNMDQMKEFMNCKWDDNCQSDWAFEPEAGGDQLWPLPEDLALNNNDYLTAAMGGFPLGDLNWHPEHLEDWEAQRDEEWNRINTWMETGENTVSAEFVNGGDTPSGYELSQNYPNPFNPTTQISYTVPEPSNVSLKVYNTLGQEIATLVDGSVQAGSHEVTFEASNLSSGIYIYRLESDNGAVSMARKMMFIK